MKTRDGYVSNSSSTSFLIAYNDIGVFDQFRKIRGYEYLENHLNFDRKYKEIEGDEDKNIDAFFTELVEGFAGEYGEYLYAKSHPYRSRGFYCSYSDDTWSLEDELKKYMLDDIVYSGVKGLESSVEAIVRQWNDSEEICDWKVVEECRDVIDLLVLQIVESVRAKWKNICMFEVGDDSDYGDYIEHTFMPMVVHHGTGASGFAGTDISHH